MKMTISALVMVIVLAVSGTGKILHAQSHFEKDPVFQAKAVVAPELLKGPHLSRLASKELTAQRWRVYESFTNAAER